MSVSRMTENVKSGIDAEGVGNGAGSLPRQRPTL